MYIHLGLQYNIQTYSCMSDILAPTWTFLYCTWVYSYYLSARIFGYWLPVCSINGWLGGGIISFLSFHIQRLMSSRSSLQCRGMSFPFFLSCGILRPVETAAEKLTFRNVNLSPNWSCNSRRMTQKLYFPQKRFPGMSGVTEHTGHEQEWLYTLGMSKSDCTHWAWA